MLVCAYVQNVAFDNATVLEDWAAWKAMIERTAELENVNTSPTEVLSALISVAPYFVGGRYQRTEDGQHTGINVSDAEAEICTSWCLVLWQYMYCISRLQGARSKLRKCTP